MIEGVQRQEDLYGRQSGQPGHTGNPSERPQGTVMAGWPVRSKVFVLTRLSSAEVTTSGLGVLGASGISIGFIGVVGSARTSTCSKAFSNSWRIFSLMFWAFA